jgi:hypothetical protein
VRLPPIPIMTASTEDDNKNDEIRDLIGWLRGQLGRSFVVTDHWEVDRSAIGVAAMDDPRHLACISSCGRPTGTYYVELEAAPVAGSDFPYATVDRFDEVDREQLPRIVGQHLRTGS